MTQEQKIIRAKVGLLELAKQLGIVPRRRDMMTLVGLCAGDTCPFVAPQHCWGVRMREPIENGRGVVQRSFGGWRIVTSAWLAMIIFVVLFAGFQALASRHGTSPRAASLSGAVIPRHYPRFFGPDEVAASDWQERAKAEAYSDW
jgi:hypothetical protein